jgi:hypothetical protein
MSNQVPKKRWIDSVKQDMREVAVSEEMTSDRGKWWKRMSSSTLNWKQGRKKKKKKKSVK